MTIEDKSFHNFTLSNPTKARDWLNQVKEVTGCDDEDKIKRAFERSRDSHGEFSLNSAIDLVLQSYAGHTPAEPVTSSGPVTTVTQQTSPQKAKVVDLTEDNKTEEDLQRAIALSLQDGGMVNQTSATTSTTVSGISQEEQDVSKALEASLLESSLVRRKTDSQNPHERTREENWPVGLKNVGQTCWFSAVIQSLFHIPAFRMLVLNYTPPCLNTTAEKMKILEFMAELRKLFSLLLDSQRKYVDPTKAVGILRGSLGGDGSQSSNQQDVSEFTHKLLDWLEEAFNMKSVTDDKSKTVCDMVKNDDSEPMDSESEKMDKEKDTEAEKPSVSSVKSDIDINQMNSLFYGQVEIEGINQGNEFTRTEQFGQWPLQVNGFQHIHDSLEASMAYQAIDSDHNSVTSGQERWFTTLPPVLFLELSRFQFNTTKGIAEKVNNVLEFPQDIFLDRYLQSNKIIVRKKREEVRKLSEKRVSLKKQLDCYMKFGEANSSHQYSLVSILQSTLEFAKSGMTTGLEQDLSMQVDSPSHSPRGPASLTPAQSLTNVGGDTLSIPIIREEQESDAAHSLDAMEVETNDSDTPITIQPPRPRFVSEMEMKVLSSCLGRWISQVDEEIVALTQNLKDIEDRINVMYEEDHLKVRVYRLHAVMVHEGDANQGHYWAYVNHTERGWLKFNDNTVSQSTWQEIIKEAVGGRSTSAYSCVYVDSAKNTLFSDTSSHLPADLDTFVMEDNKCFASEIVKWDEEQQRLKEEEATSTQPVLIGDDPECQIIEQKPDLAQSHPLLARSITVEFLNIVASEKKRPDQNKNNTSNVINKIYSQVKGRVTASKQDHLCDSADIRLDSFLHYLIANELTVEHYKKALLEQVSLQEFETITDIGREVSRCGRDSLRSTSPIIEQEVGLWHKAYHQFRIAVNYFVLGVEKYTDNLVEDALELLTISYVVNEKIIEDPPNCNNCSYKAMNKRGLVKHFHLAVEAVNSKLVEEFEAGTEPASVARRVSEILVPAINILQARTNKNSGGRDASLLEEVRGRWCAMIEQPLPDRKRDYWETIFNTVIPDDNAVVMKTPVNLRYPKYADDQKLGLRYKAAMQRIMKENEK